MHISRWLRRLVRYVTPYTGRHRKPEPARYPVTPEQIRSWMSAGGA